MMQEKQVANVIEKALNEAGTCGLQHVWLLLLVSIPYLMVGANMGAIIFEGMTPSFQCNTSYSDWVQENCDWLQGNVSLALRVSGENPECFRYSFNSSFPKQCSYWKPLIRNGSSPLEKHAVVLPTVPCSSWTFDKSIMRSTIVSEFSLVCRSTWASYISQSTFMFGMLVGNVFVGWLSDKIGRRWAFLVGGMGTFVFGTATAFTKSYLAFTLVRLAMGFFVYTMFLVPFVLVSELIVAKRRATFAQYAEACFGTGLVVLSLLAYCTRDWRHLQLSLSIPAAASIIIWWLIPESPRWLLSRGNREQAVEVIVRIRQANKRSFERRQPSIPSHALEKEAVESVLLNELNEDRDSKTECPSSNSRSCENELGVKKKYGLADLVKTPQIRRQIFIQSYQWFAVSSVYYGLTLNAAELGSDPFVNLALNGSFGVVADLLVIHLADKWGRRICATLSQFSAAIFCILLVYVPRDIPWLYIGCSLIGKFSISMTFGIIYIQVGELFPTPVRGVACGVCSACARLGGMASPLIAMTRYLFPELPYIIFAVLAFFSGIVLLTVPETNKHPLCETFEEGENFIASNPGPLLQCLKKLRKRQPVDV